MKATLFSSSISANLGNSGEAMVYRNSQVFGQAMKKRQRCQSIYVCNLWFDVRHPQQRVSPGMCLSPFCSGGLGEWQNGRLTTYPLHSEINQLSFSPQLVRSSVCTVCLYILTWGGASSWSSGGSITTVVVVVTVGGVSAGRSLTSITSSSSSTSDSHDSWVT